MFYSVNYIRSFLFKVFYSSFSCYFLLQVISLKLFSTFFLIKNLSFIHFQSKQLSPKWLNSKFFCLKSYPWSLFGCKWQINEWIQKVFCQKFNFVFELTGKKTLKTDFRLTTKDLIRKKSKINLQCWLFLFVNGFVIKWRQNCDSIEKMCFTFCY